MEGERRWEELEVDCLINILGRVGMDSMESLLLDVPFVCKSWYKATLDPSCWQYLKFPEFPEVIDYSLGLFCWKKDPSTLIRRFVDEYRLDQSRFSVTAFVKFVIGRSKRKAIYLRLYPFASEDVLKYAVDECPALKVLVLPTLEEFRYRYSNMEKLIGKLTNLEHLELGNTDDLGGFLEQISIHCQNFCILNLAGYPWIAEDRAMVIVSLLPKLKQLILNNGGFISEGALVKLLQGCKELVRLDVSNCIGFSEGDKEIAKHASYIDNFSCQGCTLLHPDEYESDYYEYDDEMVYE